MGQLGDLESLFILRHSFCTKDRLTEEGRTKLQPAIAQIKALMREDGKLGIITSHSRPTIETAFHVADSLDPVDLIQGRMLFTSPELAKGDFSAKDYQIVLDLMKKIPYIQYLIVGHMESTAFLANQTLRTLGKTPPKEGLGFSRANGVYIPIPSGDYKLIG